MSTLMFDELIVPVAVKFAEQEKISTKETGTYVAGFIEGYSFAQQTRSERSLELQNELELQRERVVALWSGIIQAMLVLGDSDPAVMPLHNALILAQTINGLSPEEPREGFTL